MTQGHAWASTRRPGGIDAFKLRLGTSEKLDDQASDVELEVGDVPM
jgi:hypothetical protein